MDIYGNTGTHSQHQFSEDCGRNRQISVGPGRVRERITQKPAITKEIKEKTIQVQPQVRAVNDSTGVNQEFNSVMKQINDLPTETAEDIANAASEVVFLEYIRIYGPIVKKFINKDGELTLIHSNGVQRPAYNNKPKKEVIHVQGMY